MKRLYTLLCGLLLAGVAMTFAPPAHAQVEYPPAPPTGGVSDSTVRRDGTVTFSGKSTPFDTVTVTVKYANGRSQNAGTVNADAEGNWSLAMSLSYPGVATLSAATSNGVVTQQVVVLARSANQSNSSSSDSQLATTGVANGQLPTITLIGAGTVMLGALLVVAGVRWRRRTGTAD
ncbi:hypothetical protein ACQEVZ_00115 [Dactylosporangium sp. CA-152071]|uniref:hypothetical protein n=1 Tax=Dactylosporangium sp. CA-152071 TaxID=3239933 RepID=UPI003D8BBD83